MLNNLFKHRRFTATLCTLICCLFTFNVSAQTDTLINPNKEGGFELGNGSFVANGWSVAANNATQINQWTSNRGATQGFTGNYCAYITNNSLATPPPHIYTVQQASLVHFYRDVTFKAGKTRNILSFSVINAVLSAPLRVAIVHRDSALTTGTQIGQFVSYGFITNYIAIDPSVIGNCGRDTTVRLVFSWSDPVNETFAQVPPAIDDISLWSEAIAPVFSGIDSVFTINNTLPTSGTNFNSLKDAVTALNSDLIGRCNQTKSLVFKVSAGQVFDQAIPIMTASGTSASPIIFQKSGTGANPLLKPKITSDFYGYGIYISGGDYITFDGIDVDGRIDSLNQRGFIAYGYLIENQSSTNGAQNITIKNSTITFDKRVSYNSKGVLQTVQNKNPSSTKGTNSMNRFLNLNIYQATIGIEIKGSSNYPDSAIEIGTTDPNRFIEINKSKGEDVSEYAVYANGIRNFNIHHINANTPIYISHVLSNSKIYSNKITTTRGIYALSIRGNGIFANAPNTALDIYNNFLSIPRANTIDRSSYSQFIGVILEMFGNNAATNFYNNSIYIDKTGASGTSSVSSCLSIWEYAKNIKLVNNIFANTTRPSSTDINHFCIVNSSSESTFSNYNAFWRTDTLVYIGNAPSNSLFARNLSEWQRGQNSIIQDANSVEANPVFLSETDLHAYGSGIDGKGTTPLSNVTVDIDNEPRTAPFDIGADQFTRQPVDLTLSDLLEPNDSTLTICDNRTRRIKVLVKNLGSQTVNFVQNPATIKVFLARPNKRDTFSLVVNTGSLAVDSTRVIALDSFATTLAGLYTFQAFVSTVGDGNRQNDTALYERRLIAPKSLPITEGFENYFLLSDWNFSANTGFINRGKTGNGITSILSPTKRNQSFSLPKVGISTDTSTVFGVDYRIVNTTNPVTPSMCKMQILGSTDCGATFTVLKTIDSTNHRPTTDFQSILIPLSNFKGKDLILKVNLTATKAQETYVDFDNVYLGTPCRQLVGTDTIITPLPIRCAGSNAALLTKLASPQTFGMNFQWQISSDTTRTWQNVPNGNPIITEFLTGTTGFPIYYRLKTTCATDGTSRLSNSVLVKATNTPAIAKLPFKESFENWQTDSCAVPNSNGIPSNFFTSTPNYGQYSWHRNDEGDKGGWSGTSGAYAPQASSGQYSARFHTYGTGSFINNQQGRMDLHIDLSGATDKQLSFDYINTDGGDGLKLYLSADGGITFTPIDTPLSISTTWRRFKYNLPANGSPTSVLRFEGNTNVIVDYATNGSDIGLDSLTINPITTAPTCTVLANPLNGATNTQIDQLLTWQAADFATGYRLKIGTTANAADVLALTDIGFVTQYRYPNFYAYDKKYFVTLEPYNRVGSTLTCASSSFTTGKNNNFGGGRDGVDSLQPLSGNYSFANSTTAATTAPIGRATYSWINPLTHTEAADFQIFNSNNRDNGAVIVSDMGINFPFFGINSKAVLLGLNGIVTFQNAAVGYYPDKIYPSQSFPNEGSIAPCHADLYFGAGSRFFYKADSTQFVATWWHFYEATNGVPDTSAYITFQLILKPDGSIKTQYNAEESSVGRLTNSKIQERALIGLEGFAPFVGYRGIQYRNKGVGARIFDAQNKSLAIVYQPSKGDIAPLSMTNPSENDNCLRTVKRPVVQFQNKSYAPINFAQTPITVQIKMTGARTQTITQRVDTGTLIPNNYLNQEVTFLSPLSMDTSGVYNFEITVKNPLDDNPTNDTIRTQITINATSVNVPYTENFNANSTTRTAWSQYYSYIQSFKSGNDGEYFQVTTDWSQSGFSSPTVGRIRKGDYVAFDYRVRKPFTDLTADAPFSGGNWKIVLQYSTDCGRNPQILDSITSATHTPTINWRQRSVKLPDSLAGQLVTFTVICFKYDVNYAFDFDNFHIGKGCDSINFDIGNLTAPPSVCVGDTARTGLFQRALAPNIKYQWQSSSNNGTTWANIADAEGNNYFLPPTLATATYRVIGTCTLNQKKDTSDTKTITAFTPAFAALPYTQSFENWQTASCNFKPFSTKDVPDANWLNLPQSGSSSWRRNDEGNLGRWTNAASNGYTPVSSQGSFSARFHSADSYSLPLLGSLNLFVDLSGTTDKTLTFDYINKQGNDSLRILLSTNGGASFRLLSTLGTTQTWAPFTYSISDGTAKSIIRFEGVSAYNYNQDDIGLDNLRVFANNFTVDAGVVSLVNPQGFGCQNTALPLVVKIKNAGVSILDLATNPVTVGATVSGALFTNFSKILDTGRLAVGESRDITLATNFNLSAAGLYNFDLLTTCAKDSNAVNNTLKTQLRVVSSQTVPFFETFDPSPNIPIGWLAEGGVRIDTSWQNKGAFSISLYMNGQPSPNPYYAGTGGSFTLPKIGVIRVEDMLAFDLRVARFNSPIPQGIDWGAIEAFVSEDCGQTWTSVWTANSTNFLSSTNLINVRIPLSRWAGKSIITRFVATYKADSYKIEFDYFKIDKKCSGAPTITAISGNSAICFGEKTTLNTAVGTGIGLNWVWQKLEGTRWTAVDTNKTQFTSEPLFSPTSYRVLATCLLDSSTRIGNPFPVSVTQLVYATLPYRQDFETWQSTACAAGSNTEALPDASWLPQFYTGNGSWRRNDKGATANWTNITRGEYTPLSTRGNYSARFHGIERFVYEAAYLDLHVNLSQTRGTKYLALDYLTGNNSLELYLSTDGGKTFSYQNRFESSSWQRSESWLQSDSARCVIRFVAKGSNYQGSVLDIGIDNLIISTQAMPTCVEWVNPQPRSSNVQSDMTLRWRSSAGAKGYKLKIQSLPSGAEFLPLTDIGRDTFYKPATKFAFLTDYYTTMYAYDSLGNAKTTCNHNIFTIQRNPNFGGGPDGNDPTQLRSGGYFFANSTAAAVMALPSQPSYRWIDPLSNSHQIITNWTSGNDNNGSFTLPDIGFNFNYFGVNYRTNIFVNSNGALHLGAPNAANGANEFIPAQGNNNNFIAGCWMDLAAGTDGKVYHGRSPNGDYVITWWHYHDVEQNGTIDAAEYITFQIILNPNGTVKVQFNDVESTADDGRYFDILEDALIGIENADGTQGIQYRNNGAPAPMFSSPLAVAFALNNALLPVEKPQNTEGVIVGTVFPNPSSGLFAYDFFTPQSRVLKLTLSNSLGQIVWSDTQQSTSGWQQKTIEGQHLPAGVYWLTVSAGQGQQFLQKVVKQ